LEPVMTRHHIDFIVFLATTSLSAIGALILPLI
jgi:hypothetical protein